jgi:hypothetical protein
MTRTKLRYILITGAIFLIGIFFCKATVQAGPVDYRLYAELLKKHVKNGVVNYQGFKQDEATLDRFLKVLENTDLKTLSGQDKFAFYINTYNAWTIKLILTGYPGIQSIKDLGSLLQSPWKKKIVRVGGDVITLDNVEHDILRATYQDPRIHFAVNCASKGCPILISEPYIPEKLDRQLTQSTINFINDPKRNRLQGNTLYVSSIFKWFKEDFHEGIVPFFLQYAQGDLKAGLEQIKTDVKIKYLDYDWSLNGH